MARGAAVGAGRSAFEAARLDLRSVEQVASIDVKADEAGLAEYARRLGVPLAFYSAAEL
ncbi:MAG: cobalamin biosynthesis protein, partial [Clostridia bacterium]|nr:cobalamin biosynthesis protein [Clostridia bacterium]